MRHVTSILLFIVAGSRRRVYDGIRFPGTIRRTLHARRRDVCDAARVYSGKCSCGEDDYTNDNERIS